MIGDAGNGRCDLTSVPLPFTNHVSSDNEPASSRFPIKLHRNYSMKRPRFPSEIDCGKSQDAKKKRRLGMVLVTSRLSPPFSIPATYIVGRGSSKVAVWARQKALGRSSLRKVAIMNRVRRRILQLRDSQPWRREMAMQPFFRRLLCSTVVLSSSQQSSFNAVAPHAVFSASSERSATETVASESDLGSSSLSNDDDQPNVAGTSPLHSAFTSPGNSRDYIGQSPCPETQQRQYIPLPSPLNLTDYDYSVFDNEDEYFDDSSDGENDGEDSDRNNHHERGSIYSDFNDIPLEPSEPALDDHDSLSAFDDLLF